MKMVKGIAPIIFCMMLFGCVTGPRFVVKVDSISAPDTKSKIRYILAPGVKNVKETDLQYLEYANYITQALNSEGYANAPDFNNADIIIFLGYGIGNPETHQYTYSTPIWGQTGGTLISTPTLTTYTPTYGVTGSTTNTKTRTSYRRYMFLDAIDVEKYKKTKETIQAWKTMVTSTGSSGDLRRIFPVLVAASKEYFGTNTGQQVKVTLTENDQGEITIKAISK